MAHLVGIIDEVIVDEALMFEDDQVDSDLHGSNSWISTSQVLGSIYPKATSMIWFQDSVLRSLGVAGSS